MKQKDYKEIGEIIKKFSRLGKPTRWLVYELADYFEREAKLCEQTTCDYYNKGYTNRCVIADKDCVKFKPKHTNKFNRKQFLKDCGVKK